MHIYLARQLKGIMMSQIRLPAVIYSTAPGMKSSDDMKYGDMTEQQLRSIYHLTDVSAKVNPYTFTKKEEIKLSPFMDYNFPDRPSSLLVDPFHAASSDFRDYYEGRKKLLTKQQCADMLFDEMRALSKPFALYGVYSQLIVKMINHMQNNSGTVFRDTLLDMALKDQILHDFSESSSLNIIKSTLLKNINWKNNLYPQDMDFFLKRDLNLSVLPKFKRFKDNFNGMGITVHDTYATQVILKSLSVSDGRYKAKVNYKVQDHFGLDKKDISVFKFRSLRFFRIWFVLQHWENFGFKPFVTEMEADICISGGIR